MRFSNVLKRAGSAAAVVGVLTSGAALAVAGPAAAEGAGTLTVCSKGDYATSVQFPARGGLTTASVPAGECRDFEHLGSGDQVEPITVLGTDGTTAVVGHGSFRSSLGGNVVSSGTLQDPAVLTPQV